MIKPQSLEVRRFRAAKSLGLMSVRIWTTKQMAQDINRMREATESMINAELKRKHSNNGDEK